MNRKNFQPLSNDYIPSLDKFIPRYETAEVYYKRQRNKVLKKFLYPFFFLIMGVLVYLAVHPVDETKISQNREFGELVLTQRELTEKYQRLYLMVKSLNGLNVEKKIERALKKYDADKLGMIDYALASGGGSITSTPDTRIYPPSSSPPRSLLFFCPSSSSSSSKSEEMEVQSDPMTMLRPSTMPGECFAFGGSTARIRVRLSWPIEIAAVALEHAPLSLLADARSAPKEFSVFGLDDAESVTGVELGQFVYDIDGDALQVFPVNDRVCVGGKGSCQYQHVELRISSNYGHENYTCVYRFRVHGDLLV